MADEHELKITEPESVDEPPVTFTEHMKNADALAIELNGFLLNRGFHVCEAIVLTNWQGMVVLSRSVMTNGKDAKGDPIHLNLNMSLHRPWLAKEEDRMESADILTKGLEAAEEAMSQQCTKMGVYRMGHDEFVKRMSVTIATATQMPKVNGQGKSRILRA